MNESDICRIFCNSLKSQGNFAYKIPDPSTSFNTTNQRPFDLFGTYEGLPLYAEVKYSNKMESLNLQRIEDHQIENLLELKRKIKCYSWIVWGIHVGRGDTRIYIFKDIEEINSRREEKRNFKVKELETLEYFEVHKELIDLESLIKKTS